MDSEI